NVYYGKINGGTEDVLYEKKEVAGKPGVYEDLVIDISGSVKEVFEKIIKDTTNNKEFTELIKQAAGTKLETEGVAVDTGNTIIAKKIFKQVNSVEVVDVDNFGYDSTFKAPIEIDTNVKFGKLLSATVIDAAGNILVNSATDITIGGDRLGKTLKFHFGSGITYTPIKPGTYQVIIEFVEE
ncbi:calcium-binding protein, partial [Myroides odoratimimus]|nr:calcium-binding protein [Myroides odoratimimus]